MKTRGWMVSVVLLAALVPVAAGAAPVVLEPTVTAVAPAEEGVPASAVFRFDVTGLPQGGNRVIEEALLEWEAPGVSADGLTEFTAYAATGSWTAVGVEAGTLPPLGEEEIAHWTIEPPDYARHGGFVRLDLTGLVQAWVAGARDNHGIVVACATVASETLAGHLNTARLVVTYGYTIDAE